MPPPSALWTRPYSYALSDATCSLVPAIWLENIPSRRALPATVDSPICVGRRSRFPVSNCLICGMLNQRGDGRRSLQKSTGKIAERGKLAVVLFLLRHLRFLRRGVLRGRRHDVVGVG